MTHKIFTVYDSKAEAYLPPMFLHTKGLAIRSFTAAVNNSGHDFNKYAADFTLMEIGEWDDNSGKIDMYPAMKNIGCGIEFLEDTTDGPRPDVPGAQLIQTKKGEKSDSSRERTANEINLCLFSCFSQSNNCPC